MSRKIRKLIGLTLIIIGTILIVIGALATQAGTNYTLTVYWKEYHTIHNYDHLLCHTDSGDVYLHGSVGWGGWTEPRFSIDKRVGYYQYPILDLTPYTIENGNGWITSINITITENATFIEGVMVCPGPANLTLKQDPYVSYTLLLERDTTSTMAETLQQNSINKSALGIGLGLAVALGIGLALLATKR